MISTEIAGIYANALFKIAESQKLIEELATQFTIFMEIYNREYSIEKFLEAPSISKDEKIKILHDVLGSNFNKYFINFLNIIIQKNRQFFLKFIFIQFEELYHTHKKEVIVEIISAIHLADDTIARIKTVLEKKYNIGIIPINKVDEDIMGGLVFKIKDKQIDMSIKKDLDNIKRNLSDTKLNEVINL